MIPPEKFLALLKQDKELAYDVETNGLEWQTCYVCGYSLSDGTPEGTCYVPVRHASNNISNPELFEKEVAAAIAARTKPLIGHNIKFDSHFSLGHGIELGPKIKDTMVAAALLDEFQKSYSLSACCKQYPDIPQKKEDELYAHISRTLGGPATRSAMSRYHQLSGTDRIGNEYAEADTLATYHLAAKQAPELYGQHLDLVYNLENNLSHVLRKMERRGVLVDSARYNEIKALVQNTRSELYMKLPLTQDFEPMNPRSNKHLQEYFMAHEITDWAYTEPTERNPNGQPSFTKSFLEISDPGRLLLQIRALDQLLSTFIEPLPRYMHEGRVYTNFNQTQGEYGRGTKTGRLSCNHPNMQQIPKRDEQLGRLFRSIFVASPGYTIVELDYSQIEPRLFAHYSGEPRLIEGYNATPPIDLYTLTLEGMPSLMGDRSKSKTLNLGLQYTMGIAKLAKGLKVSEDEAKQFYYQWNALFPNMRSFTKKAAAVAENRGYVKTILGRRAHFDDVRFSYKAANRIVQGGAADILKHQLWKVDEALCKQGVEDKVRLLLNIHDALVLEIRDDFLEEGISLVKLVMEDTNRPPFNLRVPMVAKAEKGKTWSEATYGSK